MTRPLGRMAGTADSTWCSTSNAMPGPAKRPKVCSADSNTSHDYMPQHLKMPRVSRPWLPASLRKQVE